MSKDTPLSMIFTFKVTEHEPSLDSWFWAEDVDPPTSPGIVSSTPDIVYDTIIAMVIMKGIYMPRYALAFLDRWFQPLINKYNFIDINSLHS